MYIFHRILHVIVEILFFLFLVFERRGQMRIYRIKNTPLEISRISYGCMRMGKLEQKTAEAVVKTALESEINFFDHADIYAGGRSESLFGEVLLNNKGLREKILIQTKCGIRFAGNPDPSSPGRYDFSYEHIMESVDGSLKRLHTDHVDVLLLHRPDALVEPEEVAKAFDELESAGKVRWFGVSNHTENQIRLLRKSVRQPLIINQVELSLTHSHLINEGILFNRTGGAATPASGTLDYCRLEDILVQAWTPMGGGKILDRNSNPQALDLITRLASVKGTTPEAIMIAWLLHHPAGIQPIIGTTTPERVRACCEGDGIELTREEWYALFIAGRGGPLP